MSKDKRKNIYTITIIARSTGRICLMETISSKKYAESRLARLHEIWFSRDADGADNKVKFHISLTESKLRRAARNIGQL